MVVANGVGRNALVPPSSGEFLHIAYLPSVEKVSVFVKDKTGSYHAFKVLKRCRVANLLTNTANE